MTRAFFYLIVILTSTSFLFPADWAKVYGEGDHKSSKGATNPGPFYMAFGQTPEKDTFASLKKDLAKDLANSLDRYLSVWEGYIKNPKFNMHHPHVDVTEKLRNNWFRYSRLHFQYPLFLLEIDGTKSSSINKYGLYDPTSKDVETLVKTYLPPGKRKGLLSRIAALKERAEKDAPPAKEQLRRSLIRRCVSSLRYLVSCQNTYKYKGLSGTKRPTYANSIQELVDKKEIPSTKSLASGKDKGYTYKITTTNKGQAFYVVAVPHKKELKLPGFYLDKGFTKRWEKDGTTPTAKSPECESPIPPTKSRLKKKLSGFDFVGPLDVKNLPQVAVPYLRITWTSNSAKKLTMVVGHPRLGFYRHSLEVGVERSQKDFQQLLKQIIQHSSTNGRRPLLLLDRLPKSTWFLVFDFFMSMYNAGFRKVYYKGQDNTFRRIEVNQYKDKDHGQDQQKQVVILHWLRVKSYAFSTSITKGRPALYLQNPRTSSTRMLRRRYGPDFQGLTGAVRQVKGKTIFLLRLHPFTSSKFFYRTMEALGEGGVKKVSFLPMYKIEKKSYGPKIPGPEWKLGGKKKSKQVEKPVRDVTPKD